MDIREPPVHFSGRLPISPATWQRLVAENRAAVSQGWAQAGIFATGIGPGYQPGSKKSILYVGKSAGPRGDKVASSLEQAASVRASTKWMIERRNQSAFWQLIDKVDPTRCSIAWSNVCKMDRRGGGRPPSGEEWQQVADACLVALGEEINFLKPEIILFATSKTYRSDIEKLLGRLGYRLSIRDFGDGWTTVFGAIGTPRAILTRHPQGWCRTAREKVIDYIHAI